MIRSVIPIKWQYNNAILMPAHPDKDEKSRIGYYIQWLNNHKMPWYNPDLAAYRDYMLFERTRINSRTGQEQSALLSPATVQSHLATIRGRYDVLLRDNNVRAWLYDLAPPEMSLADKKAFVDEILTRLQNAIHPTTASVKEIIKQDLAEGEHLRLKPRQVRDLLRAPGIDTLSGVRDTAIIALMVCTGIREAELCNLIVSDLRQNLRDELAILIRSGKGRKQRLVPYGPMDWCLLYVDRWLRLADIKSGPVFRGFYKGQSVRKSGITTRSVNRILNSYPIIINGSLRDIKPHDLRRTYARNAYEHGMDLERIRQNLGHINMSTTQTYIGPLDADQRRPPDMYSPPHDPQDLYADLPD